MAETTLIEHRLSLADYRAAIQEHYDMSLLEAWRRAGPFRAFARDRTEDTVSDGLDHVYVWGLLSSKRLRVHEAGHTPTLGDHDHPAEPSLDVMSRWPPRWRDEHELVDAYEDAIEDGTIEIRRTP